LSTESVPNIATQETTRNELQDPITRMPEEVDASEKNDGSDHGADVRVA